MSRFTVYPLSFASQHPHSYTLFYTVLFFKPSTELEYERDKRSMTPAYVWKPFQLILGLGLPMEVDVSMIIGYVMKFNYVLPYNASYLTDSFVRYERSIDHDDSVEENNGFDVRTSNILGKSFFYSFFEYNSI